MTSPENINNPNSPDPFYSAIIGFIDVNKDKLLEDTPVTMKLESLTAQKELKNWAILKRDGIEKTPPLSSLSKKLFEFIAGELKNASQETIDKLIERGKKVETVAMNSTILIKESPLQINQKTLEDIKSTSLAKTNTDLVSSILKRT